MSKNNLTNYAEEPTGGYSGGKISEETRDQEFTEKYEEFRRVDLRIDECKSIWKNFNEKTKGIKEMSREVAQGIKLIYKSDSLYFNVMQDVIKAHENIDKLYDTLVN